MVLLLDRCDLSATGLIGFAARRIPSKPGFVVCFACGNFVTSFFPSRVMYYSRLDPRLCSIAGVVFGSDTRDTVVYEIGLLNVPVYSL